MGIWTPSTNHHSRSRMESLPLLDYAVLLMLLIFGIAGYQHVSAARNHLLAIGNLKSSGVAVVSGLRAAETKGDSWQPR